MLRLCLILEVVSCQFASLLVSGYLCCQRNIKLVECQAVESLIGSKTCLPNTGYDTYVGTEFEWFCSAFLL